MHYGAQLFKVSAFDGMIIEEFHSDQTEFKDKFKADTSHEIGLNNNGGELTEFV